MTFNRTNNLNFQIYPPDYSTLGINVYNDETPQWFFNVSGYFGINSGDTNTFLRNEIQFVDTVRWTKGRHEIATGIDYSYGQGDIVNNFRANGRFTFSNAAPFTGDALVDFYLGKFSSFEQAIGEYKNTRMHFLATFIQDTFRVNRQLTLNLGLRWDPFFPYTDENNRLGCYRPGEKSQVYVNAPVGVVYPGDPACPEGGYDRVVDGLRPARRRRLRSVRRRQEQHPRRLRHVLRPAEHHLDQQPGQPGRRSARWSRSPATAMNNVANPYAGRTNPFPADPFNVPANVQFFLPHAVVQLRPEPEERPAAVVERDARARDHADVSGARGLRRIEGRPPGDGPRAERRRLRAGRDDGDDQPAPAAVSDLQHHHHDRVDGPVDLPRAAAHARQAHEQALLRAEQLHALEEHGSRGRGQTDRHDADQPVRPRVRLGLLERRSASPLGDVVPLADSWRVRQSAWSPAC